MATKKDSSKEVDFEEVKSSTPVSSTGAQETGKVAEDDVLMRLELFFRKYRWIVIGITGALVLGLGGYFGYQEFIIKPKIEKSEKALYKPLMYFFERDSFRLAIDGRTGTMNDVQGLATIYNEYTSTPAGQVAGYAAGISYLHLGDFDQAIAALENVEFDDSEVMMGITRLGALGDAYMDKGDMDKALDYYKQAAERYPNEFTTPVYLKKAAMILEEKGNYKEALDMYKRIQKEYFQSAPARDIDKYISRAEYNIK